MSTVTTPQPPAVAAQPQPARVPAKTIWWHAFLAAVIVGLILCAGGSAFGLYSKLRYRDPLVVINSAWAIRLLVFALAGGLVAGTLVAGWRLLNREPGQPNWSTAFVILAFLLFGLLVWPTLWTYREFGCKVFQVNRLLGTAVEVTKLPACEAPAAATP